MRTSLFDLFKIGIGPSSSHTVGPMRAALRFTASLAEAGLLAATHRVTCDLYGSLALTGLGHGTDRAVLLALSGERPDAVDPASIDSTLAQIRTTHSLLLAGSHPLAFTDAADLRFHRDQMFPPGSQPASQHPNGLVFTGYDEAGAELLRQTYYSIGGGFVVSERELVASTQESPGSANQFAVPYPFGSAAQLLATASDHKLSIAQLMLANEAALKSGDEAAVRTGIARLWQAMQDCCQRGMVTPGILPGGLNVRRRAPRLIERLHEKAAALDAKQHTPDPLAPLDWVSIYAIAVNEENAAGGRVVTAPTNGAAGVIPAVAHYYLNFLAPKF